MIFFLNYHVISYNIYTIIHLTSRRQRIIGLSAKIHSLFNQKSIKSVGPFFVPSAKNVIRASNGDVNQFFREFSLNCLVHASFLGHCVKV